MATMAEGEELQVVAKYDYTAENGQELSIRKSERLILLDDSKDWWRVKNSENRQVTFIIDILLLIYHDDFFLKLVLILIKPKLYEYSKEVLFVSFSLSKLVSTESFLCFLFFEGLWKL